MAKSETAYTINVLPKNRKEGLVILGKLTPEIGFSQREIQPGENAQEGFFIIGKSTQTLLELWALLKPFGKQIHGIRDDTNHISSYRDEQGQIQTL
jgi:hypothetical protein